MISRSGHRFNASVGIVSIAVFGIACLILGGSSRPDAYTLIVLRPIVVCCLVVFALAATRARIAVVRVPLLLLGGLAITMAIQLVPIPAAAWASVQGRASYAAALASLGLGGQAHPLSLTPDRTWNALIALLVPLTMLMGYAVVGRSMRAAMFPALIAGAMISAAFGIAQLAAGSHSILYLYELTHSDYPVGVFANRNHEGAFLAIMFPALRAWAIGSGQRPRREDRRRRRTRHFSTFPRGPIALALGIFLIPMILATGSRAGFGLMLAGFGAAYAVAPVGLSLGRTIGQRWALGGVAIGVALVVVVTIASGHAVTLQRLIATRDVTADLRVAYLPEMTGLVQRFWLFGAGFGSFDSILRGSEPDALLNSMYFNNAHNDLVELILSGGVASMIVLLVFLVWWGRSTLTVFTLSPDMRESCSPARAASLMIAMLMVASLLDYPLRTPLFGAVFAYLCALLAALPRHIEDCRLPD